MITKCTYVIAEEFDPYQNIADEALLMEDVEPGEIILFLWQNKNTVVVGRNQNAWLECAVEALEADGGHFTRRLSGGGAVYHDLGNINFTYLVAEEDYSLERQNRVIAEAMRSLGLEITQSGRNDLLIDGRKFSGHAYYKHEGKCYHHGTLLVDVDKEAMAKYLRVSANKMASKGVQSVRSRVANLSEFLPDLNREQVFEAMLAAFEAEYGQKADLRRLEGLGADRRKQMRDFISSPEWLFGPKIPLQTQAETRFPWGEVKVEMQVNEGIIRACRLYSDAMHWAWVGILAEKLTGLPFRSGEVLTTLHTYAVASEDVTEEMEADLAGFLQRLFA